MINLNKTRCFTCRDMLMLNSMAGSVLLTGEKRLDSKITRINTVEVPDIINWVGEKEFLITTGYPFKDDKEKIADIIPKLAAKKVVGMAIKPKRFIDEIPESLIEIAEKNNFIVIELSSEAVFSSIVRESLEQILAKEMMIMTAVHKIVDEVIGTVANAESGGLENALKIFGTHTASINFIVSNGTVIKPNDTDIPAALMNILDSDMSESSVTANGTVYRCRIRPLGANGDGAKFVSAVCGEDFSDLALMAIDQAIQVFSLEYNREMSVRKIQSKYKSRFVTDWITNKFAGKMDICVCAESYGLCVLPDSKYRIAVIIGACEENIEDIRVNMRRLDKNYFIAFHNEHIVIVAEVSDKAADSGIEKIYENLSGISRLGEFRLCISCEAAAEDVPKAYAEACEICRISEKCDIENRIITRSELGVYSVLSLLPEHPAIYEFRDKFIKPLKDYDASHGSELFKTLCSYYGAGCSIKAAADSLYTHYNTICYRLDRIKSILNMNIDNEEIKFQIQTAIKLDAIR